MAPITADVCTTNLYDGETVHQRCLLLTGTCPSHPTGSSSISIQIKGANNIDAFPEQVWPANEGHFKALVMLSLGSNTLKITHLHNDNLQSTHELTVSYIPLLQYPPLHLAIMVAKDSPLLIDCPAHKRGGFSSTHADLEAAIAKFRMTAYMWQAMTAEDMRLKGLERRTFRLDEEWAADTVSSEFLNARYDESLECEGAMRATAKVHVIRSSKTTAQIRDADVAQQNPSASRKNALFDYFKDALVEAGGPFTSSAHPIVAGLILDSHYSVNQKLILGHAALGCHDPNGVSLGIFGSHLTYAWPRFMEEVTTCLTDTRHPGDKVGNDNGECNTMWETCTIGQGAHIHEVGHAFGSPHRPGIMERGYAQDWPKNFLSKTAYCRHTQKDGTAVTTETPNNAQWNLADALSFRLLPHFRLPTDTLPTPGQRDESPLIQAEYQGDEELSAILHISSAIGLARVTFASSSPEPTPSITSSFSVLRFTEDTLYERFDRTEPLPLTVLALNGRETTIPDVWKILSVKTYIRLPGSTIRLYKRSVYSDDDEKRTASHENDVYEWAQLLKERGPDGRIHRATKIDLRVGCLWDGGVVTYEDGHVSHWGPMRIGGRTHQFGGHASEEIVLPPNVTIKRIDINRGQEGALHMDGVRMTLSNRTTKGELNANNGRRNVCRLEPASHETIVGFYGKSGKGFTGVIEFGIITASKSVGLDGLPESAFGLPELKNRAGLGGDGDEAEGSQDGEDDEEGGDDDSETEHEDDE